MPPQARFPCRLRDRIGRLPIAHAAPFKAGVVG
jgi:hypothetical protein